MKNSASLYLVLSVFLLINAACQTSNKEELILASFKNYYAATKAKDLSKWNFTADTLKIWFEKEDDAPGLSFKGQKIGKWAEWDLVMNSTSYYDTIWYNPDLHAVQGYFFESNDFYDLIGASANKTLRTYSFNEENKITSLLYERLENENAISDQHMDPIYDWALKNDSLEISTLYPNRAFVPSTKNAIRWIKLLEKYKEAKE